MNENIEEIENLTCFPNSLAKLLMIDRAAEQSPLW